MLQIAEQQEVFSFTEEAFSLTLVLSYSIGSVGSWLLLLRAESWSFLTLL